MSFEKLLADIQAVGAEQETMSKALPAGDGKDDKDIQAAAAEGGDADGAVAGAGGAGGAGDEDEDEDDETLGKSLGTVTLADGTTAEAVDGTELVKSLMGEIAGLKTGVATTEATMAKALQGALGLIKSQNTMLKSMQDQVAKLAGSGRGRKTVLTVTEKTTAGAAGEVREDGMSAQQFMAKSHEAWKSGAITGLEFNTIDVSLRSGAMPDAGLISKVASAKAQ